MKVKICGIRSIADALLAARLGADAIGVLVGQEHPSPDFVSAAEAAAILAALPPFVSGVLVSHRSDARELLGLVAAVRPTALQLHSPIPAAAVLRLRQAQPGLRLLKAVHMPAVAADPGGAIEPLLVALAPYAELVDGFVADSLNPVSGQVGGTGLRHDWAVTAALVPLLPRPLLLAGGLTPETVAEAIRRVRPYGVDVNSGVQGPAGLKDPDRLKRFIEAVRTASGAAHSA